MVSNVSGQSQRRPKTISHEATFEILQRALEAFGKWNNEAPSGVNFLDSDCLRELTGIARDIETGALASAFAAGQSPKKSKDLK